MKKYTVILNTQEYQCDTWEEVREVIRGNVVAPYVRFRATNIADLIVKLYHLEEIDHNKMTIKGDEIIVKAKDLDKGK